MQALAVKVPASTLYSNLLTVLLSLVTSFTYMVLIIITDSWHSQAIPLHTPFLSLWHVVICHFAQAMVKCEPIVHLVW